MIRIFKIILTAITIIIGYYLLSKIGVPVFDIVRWVMLVILLGVIAFAVVYLLWERGWVDFEGFVPKLSINSSFHDYEDDNPFLIDENLYIKEIEDIYEDDNTGYGWLLRNDAS